MTASSGEITAELLAGLSTLSLRLPALEALLFDSLLLEKTAAATTLGGTVKDEYIAQLMAPYGLEVEALSMEVTLGAADSLPHSLAMSFTSGEGALVTVEILYSYDAL